MDNRNLWIKNKLRAGWLLLAAGAVVISLGIFAERQFAQLPYNFRILTGLGILLGGVGLGYLVRYGAALKGEPSARRLAVDERDERTVWINTRAGSRAYKVSTAFMYLGLMWASFSANGALPALAGDTLWFFLAAGVLIPFGVYAASLLIDQRNL